MILDDIKKISSLDTENMYSKIIHLPEQILDAYDNAEIIHLDTFKNSKEIEKIVICGMGGSAISGDLAVSSFPFLNIQVVKDYKIPHLNEKTLVIALSYSGNTEETLSCAEQAKKVTPFFASVTSGGKLADLLSSENLMIKLKPGLPPRSAIGYLFFSLVKVLETYELISNHEETVKQTVANLIMKANAISMNQPYEMNIAKQSAMGMQDKIPIFYATEAMFAPLAYRWKCQINENAKYPAFYHNFPEMNHNEIEGWEASNMNQKFCAIFLSRFSQEQNYAKRVLAFKKLLDSNKIDYLDFYAEGDSAVEQLFSLLYLGDMISFYLAILLDVNPTTISYIDFLKAEIG
jgi:glucose/mannose-6-phosphate isomerase